MELDSAALHSLITEDPELLEERFEHEPIQDDWLAWTAPVDRYLANLAVISDAMRWGQIAPTVGWQAINDLHAILAASYRGPDNEEEAGPATGPASVKQLITDTVTFRKNQDEPI